MRSLILACHGDPEVQLADNLEHVQVHLDRDVLALLHLLDLALGCLEVRQGVLGSLGSSPERPALTDDEAARAVASSMLSFMALASVLRALSLSLSLSLMSSSLMFWNSGSMLQSLFLPYPGRFLDPVVPPALIPLRYLVIVERHSVWSLKY